MERAAQVLAAHILGHGDLPGPFVAADDLLRAVGHLILAERSASRVQAYLVRDASVEKGNLWGGTCI